jgi:hypothetical protein
MEYKVWTSKEIKDLTIQNYPGIQNDGKEFESKAMEISLNKNILDSIWSLESTIILADDTVVKILEKEVCTFSLERVSNIMEVHALMYPSCKSILSTIHFHVTRKCSKLDAKTYVIDSINI